MYGQAKNHNDASRKQSLGAASGKVVTYVEMGSTFTEGILSFPVMNYSSWVDGTESFFGGTLSGCWYPCRSGSVREYAS